MAAADRRPSSCSDVRCGALALSLFVVACGDDVPSGGEGTSGSGPSATTGTVDDSDPTGADGGSRTDDGTTGSDTNGDGPVDPDAGTPWDWNLPPGLPTPTVPQDNPMTVEKVELGRHLFYDVRLSANETQSCASCHEQARAFSDGLPTPTGSEGAVLARNAMALVNTAYTKPLTWANPLLPELENQIAVPLFGEAPIELGAIGHEDEILERLRSDPTYEALFAAAFPDEADPYTFGRIIAALACFCRALVSVDSPYDRYTYWDEPDALPEAALRGAELFFSELLECHHCHGGFNFSIATVHENTGSPANPFANTGLYDVDGNGAYPLGNQGLIEITFEDGDMGKFRAPTLRNIAASGPYLHDGSAATLEEVLQIYAAGGRTIAEGPYAGDGTANPHKSSFVSGFPLGDQELADLMAFLESLTDETFLNDPRFSDPWE